jgi:hypothetical protein
MPKRVTVGAVVRLPIIVVVLGCCTGVAEAELAGNSRGRLEKVVMGGVVDTCCGAAAVQAAGGSAPAPAVLPGAGVDAGAGAL